MRYSFGSQLFGMSLLFAPVPSILLAIAGYYLALEALKLSSTGDAVQSTQVVDYNNRMLFDKAAVVLVADTIVISGVGFFIQSFEGQTCPDSPAVTIPNIAAGCSSKLQPNRPIVLWSMKAQSIGR